MLIPPGQILHKDLSTSFTNFEKLLLELRENRFNGYVRVSFWGYEGIFLLDVGKIIQAYSSERDNFLLGQNALLRIMKKASEKDGTIDVHALPNEVTITLASVLGATLYLSEDNVVKDGLQKITQELEAEGIIGYIDLQFGGKKGFSTIYLMEGIPVETVIMSTSGRIVSGEHVYQKILEYSQLIKSSVKVYRNQKIEHIHEEDVLVMPDQKNPTLEFWSALMRVLTEQIRKVLKKEDFVDIWQSAKVDFSGNYPCLHPISGGLKWEGDHFRVHNVIPVSELNDGLVLSLNAAVNRISPRKRHKIKIGKIMEIFFNELSGMDKNSKMPDPLNIVKEIFQDHK
ncbi:MAG: hypothetical protein Kow0042_11140 [Calditrichia bacterium]